jgi:hypothetical protein
VPPRASTAFGHGRHREAHPPIVFSTLADIPTPPHSCATVVDPVTRRDDGSVDSGGWWRFPINANPWIGDDWLVIRLIWLQTFGLPTGPDGPPLSGRSASRYSSLITQNVQFGYVALYAGPDQRVGVFALAFTSEAKARRVCWPEEAQGRLPGAVICLGNRRRTRRRHAR